MPAADPDERVLLARIAASERWAKDVDRTAQTAAARRRSPNSLDYWIDECGGDVKRARSAHTAHMLKLSRRSVQVRRERRAAS